MGNAMERHAAMGRAEARIVARMLMGEATTFRDTFPGELVAALLDADDAVRATWTVKNTDDYGPMPTEGRDLLMRLLSEIVVQVAKRD